MKRNMKKLTFWYFLTFLKTYECTAVVLSTDHDFGTENETLTFICSTGTTYDFVSFLTKTTSIGDIGYINGICRTDIKTANCSCVNVTTYTCTTTLTRLNNDDSWKCRATLNSIGFHSNTVSVIVKVPIKMATINPYVFGPMTIDEGDELRLTCEAQHSIPASSIIWYLDNKTEGFYGDDYILNSSVGEIAANADRTYNTKSTLTYNVSRVNNGIGLYCNASNDENHLVSSKTIRLNVRYLPDTLLYINGHQSYGAFYMIRNSATKQYLQCSIHGGNPLASLSWSCFNGTQTDMNTPSSAVSSVSWFAGEWNDSTCTCLASHVLGWSQSKAVSVYVLFQPTVIICKVGNETLFSGILNVTLFSNVTLTCESLGNPKPNNFIWIWPANKISAGQLISFINSQRWIEGSYTLLVENVMKPSIGPTVKGYANATFDMHVQYPPKIRNLNTSIEVIEGANFSLTCEVEPGNPNVTSFLWKSTQHPEINTSDQYLIIYNISRNNEGIFTCFAHNIMHPTGSTEINGSDVTNVTIDVQYKASIIKFTAMNSTNTTVHHGDELRFSCMVDSDPFADIEILSSNGSILKNIHGNNQFKYIKNSSCLEDNGQFTCLSANKHNRIKPDRRNVTVDVKCSPLYRPNYFQITTFRTRPGTKVVLPFSVYSNPPPSNFTWTNTSDSMQIQKDSSSSDRVFISFTDDMSSSLVITSVEPWDSGNYTVRVENEIGSMLETFRIVVDSNPEPDVETSTSTNSYNLTGTVVGGTVGAVGTLVVVAILIYIFVFKKRQIRQDSDRGINKSTLKDNTRYEDLAIAHRRKPTEYSDLDFRSKTEISRRQTKTMDSEVYENLKLTSTKSSALT